MEMASDNVHDQVRYGTSLNHAKDKVQFWRDFIKHYSHPISNWIHQWQEDIKEGSQVMAVNCYPACPKPELALGMPPHSDYGTLTILTQNHHGLQILDPEKNWLKVPVVDGALVVQVGDQLEVISNGKYRSVVHRATLSMDKTRISIASLHSMALKKKVGPAPALVDEENRASWLSRDPINSGTSPLLLSENALTQSLLNE